MPVAYTNRRGRTYTLFRSQTRSGKDRYYFAKSSEKGVPCEEIPDGFEIRESPNGIVSLAKKQPRRIPESEVDLVEALLNEHHPGDDYRIYLKPDCLVVYQRYGPGGDEIADIFERYGLPVSEEARKGLNELRDQQAQYHPVLRFKVVGDGTEKRINMDRMSYLSGVEDWLYLESSGSLEALAHKTIPLLGTDEFYELI